MSKDSMDWTPGDACRKAAARADEKDVDAAIIILLNKGPKGDSYDTAFFNAGLSCSEMLALLEVQKHDILSIMRSEKHDD